MSLICQSVVFQVTDQASRSLTIIQVIRNIASFIKGVIGMGYENSLKFCPLSPFSDGNSWNKAVEWYALSRLPWLMSESIIFLDMAIHLPSYTGHKKKDSIFLLQRLTPNVTLWLLPRFDHLFTVREATCTTYCPCSLLANWLHCTLTLSWEWQRIAVGTFSGYSVAVSIWSAHSGHTTVALEINLCYVFGHSKIWELCTTQKHVNVLKAKIFNVSFTYGIWIHLISFSVWMASSNINTEIFLTLPPSHSSGPCTLVR